MVLASMDLWEIVDGSEEAPPSNADPKIIKEYQRCVKKAMSIISINLVDSQLHHIKRCKGPAEAWKTLCNIHETRSLSNILFIRRKFFTCKMQEGEDLLDHINKVKALADQLTCLEVPMRDEDVVMTLLESLPPSYEHLITALETLPMQDLTMEFVTARLMHEVSKRREKDRKLMMRRWCQCKEKEAPHLHAKTPRHATIVANQATLHDFASRPRTTTRRRRMPTKPRTMMIMPL